jgi:hypothetical protein
MASIVHIRTEIPLLPGTYHHSWVENNDDGSVHNFDGYPTNPDGTQETNPIMGWGKPLKVILDKAMPPAPANGPYRKPTHEETMRAMYPSMYGTRI